jgi:hypothetical protein
MLNPYEKYGFPRYIFIVFCQCVSPKDLPNHYAVTSLRRKRMFEKYFASIKASLPVGERFGEGFLVYFATFQIPSTEAISKPCFLVTIA